MFALFISFPDYVRQARGEIDTALDRRANYDEGCPNALRDAIRHSLLAPGKRLRPLLVLMAAEACGGDRNLALPAACAVEMVHAYSLIHDDLPAMDDDDTRRGLPTCHVKFGEANAILAGDALLAQAFGVLANEMRPPEVAVACCGELARAAGAAALVGGQADDLAADALPRTRASLESIHLRKTGALIGAALRLGGLAARGDAMQLDALTRYGRALGLAFQVVDDLLDVEGNTHELGKRTGKDEGRGKLTFPAVLGIEASRQRAAELVEEATRAVAGFGQRAVHLEGLARYVVERKH